MEAQPFNQEMIPMNRSVNRTCTALAALLLGLGVAHGGAIEPAMAQSSCRWEGGQLRCDDGSRSDSDRNRNRDRDRDDYRYYDRNEERYRDDYDNDRNNYRGDRRDLEDRIDRLYREVLGRPADRNGLRTYVDRVRDRNWSLQRVRDELANSREAESAIDRAYQEILGRRADSRGMRTYLERLRGGWSIQRVREALMNSRERR